MLFLNAKLGTKSAVTKFFKFKLFRDTQANMLYIRLL